MILVPVRLRLAAALLFICVPLAAFETIMVTHSPWWRLPYQSMVIWSSAVLLICCALVAWLVRGNRWALRMTTTFFSVWLALNVWIAVRTHNPALGYLTLLLLGLFGMMTFWLSREISRSFFDPQTQWYQGLPKPLPGLECHVTTGEGVTPFRVSRLDREGVFVFSETGRLTVLKAGQMAELLFKFREREVRCRGTPIRALQDGAGAGFQFSNMAPDMRKQLGDFIETLRGEGYVV